MLTLEQLYYGMMLPSGNDAALVIADHFGKILAKKKPDQEPPKSSQFSETSIRFFLS